MSLTRAAVAAALSSILVTGPARAVDFVTCGGEGEDACGVLDAAFWQNGTGFCDAGLAADVRLPFLLGGAELVLYAQRSTSWLDLKNFNDQTLLQLKFRWSELGDEVESFFSDHDAEDYFSLEEVDEECVDLCPGEIDCEICIPIYAPALASEVIDLASALGAAFASLGPAIAEIGDLDLGFQIPFTISAMPRLDYDPRDFIAKLADLDFEGAADVLRAWAERTIQHIANIRAYLDELGTFLRGPVGRCRNWIRHDWQGARDALRATWGHWATTAQRRMNVDEPLSWQQLIDSHNAYNAWADGYILPNQWWSMSDQLDMGARSLELDPNYFMGAWRLCHAKDDDAGCSGIDRLLDNGLKEIRNWLDAHPDEVIILRMENYASSSEQEDFLDLVEGRLGDKVVRQAGLDTNPDVRFPSPREMLAAGKQVVLIAYHSMDTRLFHEQLVTERSVDEFFAVAPMDVATYVDARGLCSFEARLAKGAEPTTATGDRARAFVFDDPSVLPYGVTRTYDSEDAGTALESRELAYRGCALQESVAGGCETTSIVTGGLCADAGCDCQIMLTDTGTCDWVEVAMSFEDKTVIAPAELVRVHESRPLLGGLDAEPGDEEDPKRLLDEASARLLGSCRVNLVSVDFLHAKEHTPEGTCESAGVPLSICRSADRRVEATAWSWEPGDRGQRGDATVQSADGRWSSRAAIETHRFACARPREPQPERESGACLARRAGEADTWHDPDGAQWCVTDRFGAWTDGGRACLDGCGDGWVFGAPRNGWQAQRLVEAMEDEGAASVWIAVDDTIAEGAPSINLRPSATSAVTPGPWFEGSAVGWSATGSCDPEGAALAYDWSFGDGGAGVGTTTGASVSWIYGDDSDAGTYGVRVVADDGRAGADDRVTPIVVHNVAPVPLFGEARDELGARIPEDVPVALIGLVVSLDGTYHDVGWLDDHTAIMAWGDGSTSAMVVTIDAITPPAPRTGTLAASHAWGVAGTMQLVLALTDDVDTTRIARPLHVATAAEALLIVRDRLAAMAGARFALKWLEQGSTQLARGNRVSGLVMIEKALDEMAALGLPFMSQLVALAAKSEAVAAVAEAEARGVQAWKLVEARLEIASGDAALRAGRHAAAASAYRRAVLGLPQG